MLWLGRSRLAQIPPQAQPFALRLPCVLLKSGMKPWPLPSEQAPEVPQRAKEAREPEPCSGHPLVLSCQLAHSDIGLCPVKCHMSLHLVIAAKVPWPPVVPYTIDNSLIRAGKWKGLTQAQTAPGSKEG